MIFYMFLDKNGDFLKLRGSDFTFDIYRSGDVAIFEPGAAQIIEQMFPSLEKVEKNLCAL